MKGSTAKSRTKRGSKGKGLRMVKPRGLSTVSQHTLILCHRETALKLARRVLRGWGVVLTADEIGSAADMALCEAAASYVPTPGATFVTYFYYYLLGSLRQTVKFLASANAVQTVSRDDDTDSLPDARDKEAVDSESVHASTPEDEAWRAELRERCRAAMARLTPLERRVLNRVVLEEHKVASAARECGLSRGYLFNVRRRAMQQVRGELEDYREAA